jgi:LysM repeat protein
MDAADNEETAAAADDTDEAMTEEEEVADSSAEGTADSDKDSETTAETTDDAAETTTEETADTTDEETAAEATTTTTTNGPTTTYVVRPGDNLFLIGLPYGLQWTEIAAVNDLDNPNDLTVGQEIIIPAVPIVAQPLPMPMPMPATYVVQPGDNLFRVALRYNMDWRYLAQANHIGWPHYIYVGQTLVIPGD